MDGKIKHFDPAKGWGFITGNDSVDYFAHKNDVVIVGYWELTMGERVLFDAEESERGPRATNIRLNR